MPESVDSDDIAAQAANLRLAITRMARRLRQQDGSDLGPAMLSALDSIERFGPLSPSALAEAEGIKAPTVTRILGGLDREGLIDRSRDPIDGRGSVVAINEAGRAILNVVRTRKESYLVDAMRGLPAADLMVLSRAAGLLKQLTEVPVTDYPGNGADSGRGG